MDFPQPPDDDKPQIAELPLPKLCLCKDGHNGVLMRLDILPYLNIIWTSPSQAYKFTYQANPSPPCTHNGTSAPLSLFAVDRLNNVLEAFKALTNPQQARKYALLLRAIIVTSDGVSGYIHYRGILGKGFTQPFLTDDDGKLLVFDFDFDNEEDSGTLVNAKKPEAVPALKQERRKPAGETPKERRRSILGTNKMSEPTMHKKRERGLKEVSAENKPEVNVIDDLEEEDEESRRAVKAARLTRNGSLGEKKALVEGSSVSNEESTTEPVISIFTPSR